MLDQPMTAAERAADAAEWAAMEEDCLDALTHERRMQVLGLADECGLSPFQALLVLALARTLIRGSDPDAEF